jgi:hypothetical protein
MNDTYDRWHQFVANRDLHALESILADDIVFFAPTYWKPRTGKLTVMLILTAVTQLFEDFSYERRWVDDRDWALEFSARLGDLSLKGIDLIHLNDHGLIESLEVMIRPPNAVAALRSAMELKLEELQQRPSSAP